MGNKEFQSVLKVLDNDLGDDVHMLWSPSKIGLSGFRVGVLVTQNEMLLAAMSKLNNLSTVSHPIQILTMQVLTDDSFIDQFLADSRAQLNWSYTICTRKLEEMVIPYIPADAGLFVYADFSSLLPSNTFEGEESFAKLVQNAARVVMTPGFSQKEAMPGHFRICYAWVSPDVLEIAMERLSYLVSRIRRYNWDDLDPSFLEDVVKVRNDCMIGWIICRFSNLTCTLFRSFELIYKICTHRHIHRNPSFPLDLLTRNFE